MNPDIGFLKEKFRQRFNGNPQIFRAPGRINLIGEHTDYNQGFVMPAAIAPATYVLANRRSDRKISVFSLDFDEGFEFSLNEINKKSSQYHWKRYVFGTIAVFESLLPKKLSGANLLVWGNVPIGSGLSSSASLETAVALAFLDEQRHLLSDLQIALACQRAENEYAGAQCGIMDQYASIFGKKDTALLLDCRTLTHQEISLPTNFEAIICNTMVKHNLAGGEYNRRRAECAEAVTFLQKHFDSRIRDLSDISFAELSPYEHQMPQTLYRRARHVVTENERTRKSAESLKNRDLPYFGKLLLESHQSLRDDYQVSCTELDFMVETAKSLRSFFGGRMMGGGFGGCTVNVVNENFSNEFCTQIAEIYEKEIGIKPEIYRCRAAQGAGKLDV